MEAVAAARGRRDPRLPAPPPAHPRSAVARGRRCLRAPAPLGSGGAARESGPREVHVRRVRGGLGSRRGCVPPGRPPRRSLPFRRPPPTLHLLPPPRSAAERRGPPDRLPLCPPLSLRVSGPRPGLRGSDCGWSSARRRRGPRTLPGLETIADTASAAATTGWLRQLLPARPFFLRFRTRSTWAERAKSREMLQGYGAASPQARGTRGSAGAAGLPRWVETMPGDFPSGPQVLPEVRAGCSPRLGRSGPPRLPALTPGLSLRGGRISSAPPLGR